VFSTSSASAASATSVPVRCREFGTSRALGNEPALGPEGPQRPGPCDRHHVGVEEGLRRFWFEFEDADPHGCRLPYRCGVTGWSERDALELVGNIYCEQGLPPTPQSVIPDFDVSTLDDDQNVRPNLGVPVWRGIWYPFVTRS
jgi:hypothetical protein